MTIIVNAVIKKGNKILTIKRRKEPLKGMYGFPGGHVEKGETNKEALEREMIEETNSTVKVGTHIATIRDLGNEVYLYNVEIIESKPFTPTCEITEIKWLSIENFISNLKQYKIKSWKEVEEILLR